MTKKIVIAVIVFFVVVGAIIGIATSDSTPAAESQQEENLSGLSEATRMQIYREIVLCEQVADRNAMRHYHPECGSCPEFIEADMEKYLNESSDLLAKCKETITSQYNITEGIYWDIVVEGIENNWVTDYQGIPDCCSPQSSQLTIAEQNYLTSTGEISSISGNALTELSNLLGDYQLGNEAWTLQVAAQIVIIRGEYEKTANLVPPDSLANVHNKFYLGMSCFNEMTYLLIEGIDNIDADLIEEASIKLDEGSALILEAVDLINYFNAAHGL